MLQRARLACAGGNGHEKDASGAEMQMFEKVVSDISKLDLIKIWRSLPARNGGEKNVQCAYCKVLQLRLLG